MCITCDNGPKKVDGACPQACTESGGEPPRPAEADRAGAMAIMPSVAPPSVDKER